MPIQTNAIVTHTPGPWKTVEPGHGHATEYLCVQIGEDEQYTTLELKPADARLMAAAPDGLEAAKFALSVLLANPVELSERMAIERLEAFIVKATGVVP